jgi:PST family polysaccharide transporter
LDLDPRSAGRSAATGVAVLAVRTVLTQGIAFVGTVVLLRVLSPEDLGTFAVLQFALTFLQFFGDVGVGAALVQGREEPSRRALASVFTLQAILGALLVAIAWIAAPAVVQVWKGLPAIAPMLLRAMALSFLITVLRVVPSILLERRLRFGAIAVTEVMQTAAFYAVACASALRGLGDWTWPLAVVAQALVGTIVVLVAQPWRPALALDVGILRPLVRFGLPFQLKNVVGFANGAVTPLYGGAALGPTAVGFVNWGQQLAHVPLRLVEVIARVSFPLFARLQHERDALARIVERSLQVASAGVFFASGVFLSLGRPITTIVFTDKWLPGLLALYALSLVLCIGFVSPVAGAAFDAMGRPGIMARLSLGWTALNWIVVPVATSRWGLEGFVLGLCVHVVVGNLVVLVVLRRLLPEVRFLRAIRAPLGGGLATLALGWLVLRPWVDGAPRLVLAVAAAAALHVGVIALLDRQALRIVRDLLSRGDPA